MAEPQQPDETSVTELYRRKLRKFWTYHQDLLGHDQESILKASRQVPCPMCGQGAGRVCRTAGGWRCPRQHSVRDNLLLLVHRHMWDMGLWPRLESPAADQRWL